MLGLVDLSCRQRDLDVRREQRRTIEWRAGLGDDSADCRERGGDVVLRQAQQCKTRLRLVAVSGRGAICLLRLREVAAQAMELSLDVAGPRGRALIQHPLRADASRLLQRGLPRSLELHDLGAVHQADARVRDHVGLPLAPECQGSGPLSSAAQLVRALTDRDRVAVEDPRHDRRQLPRRDRDHALVDEPEALLGSPQLEKGVALVHHADRDQVAIAEALTDVGGLGSQGACRFEVTLREVAEHRCEEEVAALDALLTVALEQPLPASKPSTCRRPLASHQEIQADPPRAERGSRHLARVEVGVVSALEAAKVFVVTAEHVGRRREQLEILRLRAGSLRRHATVTRTRRPMRASRTTPGRARASSSPTP